MGIHHEPTVEAGRAMGKVTGTCVETYNRYDVIWMIDYTTGAVSIPPVVYNGVQIKCSDAVMYRRGASGPWKFELDWKWPPYFGSSKLQFSGDPNTVAPPPPEDCCC